MSPFLRPQCCVDVDNKNDKQSPGEVTRLLQSWADGDKTALEALRFLSLLLAPVLPRKCRELRAQLGLGDAFGAPGADVWPKVFGELVPGTRLVPGPPLFPRIDATEAEGILERLTAAGELD